VQYIYILVLAFFTVRLVLFSHSFVHILAFICLFFFLYFCGRVCSFFFFFTFIIVCLALSHMIANYTFLKKKHFVVLFFSTCANFIYMCNFFYLFEPAREKKKRIYVVLDRYTYVCDGCIFGIKPTHCECWFQL